MIDSFLCFFSLCYTSEVSYSTAWVPKVKSFDDHFILSTLQSKIEWCKSYKFVINREDEITVKQKIGSLGFIGSKGTHMIKQRRICWKQPRKRVKTTQGRPQMWMLLWIGPSIIFYYPPILHSSHLHFRNTVVCTNYK